MAEAFDPLRLTPSASLNRVVIADLPGVNLPTDIRQKRAGELLSADALGGIIRARAEELQLPMQHSTLDDRDLPHRFGECLIGSSPLCVRELASDIARRFASRMGYVLLTLKRGDVVNRAARPEWNDSYWSHWAKLEHVAFGGGLLQGPLGARFTSDLAEFWST